MLILTRRPQEAIYIGDTIKITISSIKGNLIRVRTATPELLVVTRKVGESFNVGDNIKLSLIRIKGMQVRIGIEAPKGISVHREEIYNVIQAKKAQQATANA